MAALEAIGPRAAGTANEERAAQYIQKTLEDAGYSPVRQPFPVTERSGRGGAGRQSANIFAVKKGNSARELIVGAHYDSETRGPGADDNASGVGVLLEAASALRDAATPYTVRFIAFGAEEVNLQGSTHYVRQMTAETRANSAGMINLDSLAAGDFAYVYGDPGSRGKMRDWILALASREGWDLRTQQGLNPRYPAGTTGDFSDHAPFRRAGIEYAYFESTNWNLGARDGYTQVDTRLGENGYIWHTPFDTLRYLESNFPGRTDSRLNLFSRLLYRLLTEYPAQ